MKKDLFIKRAVSVASLLALSTFLLCADRIVSGGNHMDAQGDAGDVTSEAVTSENPGKVSGGEVHEYMHPDDGYYCLLEDGVEYELREQQAGTCWICASTCAMITAYRLKHEGTIEAFDDLDLVDEIFDEDENGGVSGGDEHYGGVAVFVVNELSRGFLDGYVLDGYIQAQDWSLEEIKEGIQKYGALYIGIPDSRKRFIRPKDGYLNLNFPNPEPEDYDHSIAIVGWDDHFPKEYFAVEASRDGAWIAYNSNTPGKYYYVSYDTPFDRVNDLPAFMSVTDEYTKVLTHDGGRWTEDTAGEGETVTANVFKEEGKLAAVGTYITRDDSDLTVRIMTPDLKEVLYSAVFHAPYAGYCVIPLDTPMEVTEYAIAVTYPDGAPVEGESFDESPFRIKVSGNEGESFILVGDEWLDLCMETTWDRIGFVTNNACIRALYVK